MRHRYYPGINNGRAGCAGSCPEYRTLYEEMQGEVCYRELECVACGWVHVSYTPADGACADPATFAQRVVAFRPGGR